jgi:uncharacterized protein
MAKDFDPQHLDVYRFAEEAAEAGRTEPLGRFARLAAETDVGAAERPVRWQARGELVNPHHVHPQVWLHLQAEATLPLICQRCLHPVDVPLNVDRAFRFVADEATAAAQDDDAEEDLLALSRNFDLRELIEDELLMEMPVAPRHEVCPEPVKMAVADADFDAAGTERENPFAVLGQLKPAKH